MRWIVLVFLTLGLAGTVGADPELRYTNCVEDENDSTVMTCRRVGTEFYRDFTCQPDGRCFTSEAGNHPTIFVEERDDQMILLPLALKSCMMVEFADHPGRFFSMAKKAANDLNHDWTAEVCCRGQCWMVELVE